jgi:hypothetical protein
MTASASIKIIAIMYVCMYVCMFVHSLNGSTQTKSNQI